MRRFSVKPGLTCLWQVNGRSETEFDQLGAAGPRLHRQLVAVARHAHPHQNRTGRAVRVGRDSHPRPNEGRARSCDSRHVTIRASPLLPRSSRRRAAPPSPRPRRRSSNSSVTGCASSVVNGGDGARLGDRRRRGGGASLTWWPRSYTSTAKFLVRNAREEMVVTPATAPPRTIARVSRRRRSTRRSSCCAAATSSPRWWPTEAERARRGRRGLRTSPLERALRGLSQPVAGTIRKTNLIQVCYRAAGSRARRGVVQHLADAYLAAHLACTAAPAPTSSSASRPRGGRAGRPRKSWRHWPGATT